MEQTAPTELSDRDHDDVTPARRRAYRTVVWLVLAAAAAAVLVATAIATGLWSPPAAPVTLQADAGCTDPPCLPESMPPVSALPLAVPLLLIGVALALAAVLLALSFLPGTSSRSTRAGQSLLLIGGTLFVLAGAELLPHVATVCWAGEVDGVCVQTTARGIDYVDRLHLLSHALVGWIPLAVAVWWMARRYGLTHPEVPGHGPPAHRRGLRRAKVRPQWGRSPAAHVRRA